MSQVSPEPEELEGGGWQPMEEDGVVYANPPAQLADAEKQYLAYISAEAESAVQNHQTIKAQFQASIEVQADKIAAVREFSSYLAKKYNLTDEQDIDADGNIIARQETVHGFPLQQHPRVL